MIRRWLVFAACAVAGGALGWWIAFREGMAWGLLVGAAVWQLIDSFYARRLLAWLRSEQSNETPVLMAGVQPNLPGVWGDAADRIRRLLKNSHQHYSESQARLDEFLAALQASPNGVVLLDDEGRIEWCNQTAAQHFGFDARRDLQQHIANLVRDPAFNAYMATANFSHEVVIPGNFSTPNRPVKLSVHVHRYRKDRKLLLSRDITALEQAEVMRRDFVANVSHEIRTPLTVLSGFIETMVNLQLSDVERRRVMELMAQQTRRMQSLVGDLLTLAQLEGSPRPAPDRWVNLQRLFLQVHADAKALSAGRHHFLFQAPLEVQLAGAESELLSALANLVTNAVRYTPADRSIAVSWCGRNDGSGEIEVKDDGPGIAREHLPRLTERFYRVDGSRSRDTGGTGLGLSIVKHVMLRHGGELDIQSELGKGSSFKLIFPSARVRTIGATNAAAPAVPALSIPLLPPLAAKSAGDAVSSSPAAL